MAEQTHYLLLGGGATSTAAARAIRAADTERAVVMVGGEPYLPYDRPPLSKGLLKNPSLTADDISSVDNDFYERNQVRVLTGIKADRIDAAAKSVTLSDGTVIGYEKLLIATGSHPTPLKADGDGLDRVLYLRTFDDSVAIREALDQAKSCVLIGSGYIGMEVAAACVAKGVQATIVEPKNQPWSKFASKPMGEFLQRHYEAMGVRFLFNDEVVGVDRDGAALRVRTKSGERLSADVVVAGVGVAYNTDFVKASGLPVDEKGRVAVNAMLQTEADPSIWAAGDFAVYPDALLGKPFNAEHHLNAKWQGTTAGRNMAGGDEAFDKVAYFFSDMNELHMILRGKADDVEHTRFLGDVAGEEFVELYPGKEGELKMAIGISGSGDDKRLDMLADRFETMIRERTPVDQITEAHLAAAAA